MRTLPKILHAVRWHLEAESTNLEVVFPYILEQPAPISKARALKDYECAFVGKVSDNRNDFILRIWVHVTNLCPCSKAISDYRTDNQRGYIGIEVGTLPSIDGGTK